jgi:hypothetical protein
MTMGGDWVIDWPTTVAPPCTGISSPIGCECCAGGNGDVSLSSSLVGITVLAGRWSCHGHDGGAVPVGCWGCRAPGQESPPLVLFAIVVSIWHCPSVHTAPFFLFLLQI